MKPLLVLVFASAAAMYAQNNPLSSEVKQNYNQVKDTLLRGTDKIPAADYGFKPTPDVRSYGEVVTHIAEVQMALCTAVTGETRKLDTSKTDKASAVATLKASFDYCDPVYDALTDASAVQTAKMFGRERTKLGILDFNIIHDNEMYGYMAVYLRLKGLVPPSSEPRGNMGKKGMQKKE
jgi:uncharacterized damage-inducible protein DinB